MVSLSLLFFQLQCLRGLSLSCSSVWCSLFLVCAYAVLSISPLAQAEIPSGVSTGTFCKLVWIFVSNGPVRVIYCLVLIKLSWLEFRTLKGKSGALDSAFPTSEKSSNALNCQSPSKRLQSSSQLLELRNWRDCMLPSPSCLSLSRSEIPMLLYP